MTKSEKIRAFILTTMSTVDGVVATLSEHPQFKGALLANPSVVTEMREDFVKLMAPFYEPISEAALDSAIAFHSSPHGQEFRKLDSVLGQKAAAVMQMWASGVEKRLTTLAKKAKSPN